MPLWDPRRLVPHVPRYIPSAYYNNNINVPTSVEDWTPWVRCVALIRTEYDLCFRLLICLVSDDLNCLYQWCCSKNNIFIIDVLCIHVNESFRYVWRVYETRSNFEEDVSVTYFSRRIFSLIEIRWFYDSLVLILSIDFPSFITFYIRRSSVCRQDDFCGGVH